MINNDQMRQQNTAEHDYRRRSRYVFYIEFEKG